MEDYLLGEFSDSINSQIGFNKNLEHVDDYKLRPVLSVNFSRAPQVK